VMVRRADERIEEQKRMRWAGHVARMGGRGMHICGKLRSKETTGKIKTYVGG
jgi:hypothetical protein